MKYTENEDVVITLNGFKHYPVVHHLCEGWDDEPDEMHVVAVREDNQYVHIMYTGNRRYIRPVTWKKVKELSKEMGFRIHRQDVIVSLTERL